MSKQNILLFSILLFSACGKPGENPAEDSAENPAEKFVGTYNATEFCSISGEALYVATIELDEADKNKIVIIGLYDDPTPFVATVNGDSFAIREQFGEDIYIASGDGSIDENGEISITYTAAMLPDSEACTALFLPQ